MSITQQQATSVNIYEQLRSVPKNAILKIDTPNPLGVDTRSIPVGAMCHEAAQYIEQHQLLVNQLNDAAILSSDTSCFKDKGLKLK